MNILTFTTLYPNAAKPTFAVFVENRLRHLIASYPVQSVVVAPVPWIPFLSRFLSAYKHTKEIPSVEVRHNIKIVHPRFLHIPLLGGWLSPILLALSAVFTIKKLQKEGGQFQLIDAHYFYPDGAAAILLGKLLGVPVVITARGSDVNMFPHFRLPRMWITWAARKADKIITVSQALKTRLIELGVDEGKISVLRNGVDLEMFVPHEDRDQRRKDKNLEGTVFLSVGRLEGLKGHDLVIRALVEFETATLLIAGDGPLRNALEKLAEECGVAARVRFLGAVSHGELPAFYNMADVLVLASSREGWPNVLLEAMACGTPVVATRVGGIPEVVAVPAAGGLANERTVAGIANALHALLQVYPGRKNTRKYAEGFSWDDTSSGQFKLFNALIEKT